MNPSPRQFRTRTTIAACAALFLAAALALPAAAQKPKPAPKPHPAHQRFAPQPTYLLDFTVRQLRDGRVINQRRFDLMAAVGQEAAQAQSQNTIIPSGRGNPQQVGISIFAYLSTLHRGVTPTLTLRARITSVGAKLGSSGPRVVHHLNTVASAAVRVGVPVTLAKISDVGSSDQYEITVTAFLQKP